MVAATSGVVPGILPHENLNSKTRVNFWVDLATGISFCVLIGSGVLMKWVLPPGTCDGDGVKVWLGHSRHWWGDIHFWVAMLLLVLMVVHVWLHWNWVVKTWTGLVGSGWSARTLALTGVMVAAIVVPLLIPPQLLAIESSDEHPAAADTEAAAGTAPCGIEGLSCNECPAADDRLFGGGCGSDETGETETDPALNETEPVDPVAKDGECSDCTQCPDADGCPSSG